MLHEPTILTTHALTSDCLFLFQWLIGTDKLCVYLLLFQWSAQSSPDLRPCRKQKQDMMTPRKSNELVLAQINKNCHLLLHVESSSVVRYTKVNCWCCRIWKQNNQDTKEKSASRQICHAIRKLALKNGVKMNRNRCGKAAVANVNKNLEFFLSFCPMKSLRLFFCKTPFCEQIDKFRIFR